MAVKGTVAKAARWGIDKIKGGLGVDPQPDWRPGLSAPSAGTVPASSTAAESAPTPEPNAARSDSLVHNIVQPPEKWGLGAIQDKAVSILRGIYDPEMPVNILDLGLVYQLRLEVGGQLHVYMTLTSPACPMGEQLRQSVITGLRSLRGVESVHVHLVWEPAWNPQNLPEHVRLELGMF